MNLLDTRRHGDVCANVSLVKKSGALSNAPGFKTSLSMHLSDKCVYQMRIHIIQIDYSLTFLMLVKFLFFCKVFDIAFGFSIIMVS